MKRPVYLTSVIGLVMIMLAIGACDKAKIVTSTEYVEKTEYIELPPDTVVVRDTVVLRDSSTTTEYDTVYINQVVHDTVIKTVTVHDTVFTTITVHDTVTVNQNYPNLRLAYAAMQYHTDPMVLSLVQAEYGVTGGWVLYLSLESSEVRTVSQNIYEITGVIDYWTEDWAEFLPLDFSWRMTYNGGDPSNPNNWTPSEPQAVSGGKQPGVNARAQGFRSASSAK